MRTFKIIFAFPFMVVCFFYSPPESRAAEAVKPKDGLLNLTIIDGETGEETPARVQVINEAGESFLAEDALPIAVNYVADDDAVLVDEPWNEGRLTLY